MSESEQAVVVEFNYGLESTDAIFALEDQLEAAIEEAKSHPKVSSHLEGKEIKRIIYVPGRILNIVAA